ncbi:flavin reductase family protein [Streptomyces sp. ISL-11]|uniref:flavin reductase family protein n=1 Tax=Streptomyces sp. ISL-11 TaxID=2819174 RepID=UPI001BE972D3|nr:flavin reductase family protein [Streptomyces sp. ISL-11]MBT2383352.1 flavin reductase family protein [Streptomyces sp. ISL-11]
MSAHLPTAVAERRGVSRDDFREVMTRFPACVTVVTAYDEDGPAGCTATAVVSLTDRPPSMAVSLNSGSGTLRRIVAAGTFAVNVLPAHLGHLVEQFATAGAAHRFDGVDFGPRHGAPVLAEAVASVVCDVTHTVPLLDHTLLVGAVVSAGATDDGEPLVLYRRAGHRLGGHRLAE